MEEQQSWDILGQTGSPGLRRAGGFIIEERLPQLQGTLAARIYREMGDNDPVVGAVLYVVQMLCRGVEWKIEAAAQNIESIEARDFVEECRTDMSHTWEHFIGEALSCIQYGWAYHEIVYKIRRGPTETDGRYRSKYKDGRIGWRKLDLRAQDSLLRWEYDAEHSLRGLWQLPQDIYRTCFVPIEKALLFRIQAPRNNPEGRSLLRNGYRPWFMSKRLEEIEGIGIERDLAGLPIFEVPFEWLSSTATPSQKALVASLRNMVQRIRRNENEGAVIPGPEMPGKDGQTIKTGLNFRLVTSGGSRQIQPDVAIRRHQSRLAMTMLCEWLMLGTDKTGSFALIGGKTDLFAQALIVILDAISSVMNTYAIPRLMTLNGYDQSVWPKLVHGDVADVDIVAVAEAINALVGATVITPDDELERKVRSMMGLPEPAVKPKPSPMVVPTPAPTPSPAPQPVPQEVAPPAPAA